MRHRATRTTAAVFASLFAMGALAACDDGGTPEQTGQVPPAETGAPAAEQGTTGDPATTTTTTPPPQD